jgi:hypothetical protein
MIFLKTSLEGPKKLKHADLSWEHNMDMFLRYNADPGFPIGIEELGGHQSTVLKTMSP